MKKSIIIEIIAALLILLFFYTGLNKLLEPGKFEFALTKSPVVANYYKDLAKLLPIIELVVGTLLIFPQSRRIGFYGSFLLMTIFTIYIGGLLLFSTSMPCSCGGVLEQMNWSQHLIFNIVFLVLSLVGLIFSKELETTKLLIQPNHINK
jgi:hypothetical protein